MGYVFEPREKKIQRNEESNEVSYILNEINEKENTILHCRKLCTWENFCCLLTVCTLTDVYMHMIGTEWEHVDVSVRR